VLIQMAGSYCCRALDLGPPNPRVVCSCLMAFVGASRYFDLLELKKFEAQRSNLRNTT
jgi:hypothetical protein